MNNDFTTQLDNMLEAQAQLEIVRGGYDDRLARIERELRDRVMEVRQKGEKLSVLEMTLMIEEAMEPEFGQPEINYSGTIKNLPDEKTYYSFSCDLGKYFCWIYMRAI